MRGRVAVSVCVLGLLVAPLARADSGASGSGSGSSTGNRASVQELSTVEVIGTAPLPGLGSPLNQVPANVQTGTAKDLQKQQSLSVSDYLNTNFSGVNVNEAQDNPFQPDVNYHGFTASPLLGTPEGLSVYQDGVRVNESFGDVVNWDLIPESAISSVTLIPGSNPVFGLNTLGGALSIQTKSGHDNPGSQLEASGGSFGRRDFQGETGGAIGHFDYFLTGNYFDEDGWRDLSQSHVRQLFGKVGWEKANTDVHVSYAWADTNLTGNGTTPVSLLNYRRASIFTAPDNTKNHLNFINATGTHFFTENLLLSGNLYYRQLDTQTFNGDINDNYANSPSTETNGVDNGSHLIQRTLGAGLQLTDSQRVFGLQNQAIGGVSIDRARDTFSQFTQSATVTADHSTAPAGPRQTTTNLYGTSQAMGAYLTDTLSPDTLLHLIASARYNRIVETLDGISYNPDNGTSNPLVGDHKYHRLNPAVGFTLTPSKTLTLYADYNEGSRAPTVIELGCADPNVPCGLPNAFAGDPDLHQVVARTIEIGGRGALLGRYLGWSADVFHTRSSHDIQFITTSTLNGQGYFDNVGNTRRQGADVGFNGKLGQLTWHLSYSLVDATYQSAFQVSGASNSTADANGVINVQPGNRIPLVPRHVGRLVLDYAVTPEWDVGATMLVSSGSYLRGNENNATQPSGTDPNGNPYLGTGRIGGYAVIDLNSNYQVCRRVNVFLKLSNLLNRDYATSGLLSQNVFNPNGSFRSDPATWTNEDAVSPAAPRAVWAGVRISWQ